MKTPAKKLPISLDEHRLDGETVSAGCISCPLLAECGGYTRRGGGWSCMDRCVTCDPARCDLVCLTKHRDFARALLEVGGFGGNNLSEMSATPRDIALPHYVPAIQHRTDDLHLNWVALPLRAFMRFRDGTYEPIADSAISLRAKLGLASHARLVLLGTGKDRPIETYWRFRRRDSVPEKLAALGFECAIAPNYSLFLDDPRTHHMFNRKRSLICAEEFSRAGVPSIPYLQTVAHADWTFWRDFLKAHAEIAIVAKEFQTGLAHPERGKAAIAKLQKLQDEVGRDLHVVAIGGARYRMQLRAAFASWTVIDSVPFMKAVKRRAVVDIGKRVKWAPALGEVVGHLAMHNVASYSRWIA